jgi:hypothetical protein
MHSLFLQPSIRQWRNLLPLSSWTKIEQSHHCNHCNIPGFLCSCFPALTFVWVATPRSCARLPCSLVICWRNRINCTASIFVAACTPSAYVLTDTEKTGIQKVYIPLGFLLWISLAEAKQWYQLWTRSLGSERVHIKAAEEHTSFPVFAVFFISATSFFSCNHDGTRHESVENNFCRSTILFPFWSQKTHICSSSFAVFPSFLSTFWRGFQLSVPLIAMIQPLVRFLSEKQTIDQQSQ